jgi:N-glycosidase YbiA
MLYGPKIKSFTKEYSYLSNFYPSLVMFDGQVYPTVEHAYVAAKTLDLEVRKKIQKITNPGQVKKFGKTIALRDDWEDVKISIMEQLCWQKFSNNSSLAEKLLSTDYAELIEGNTWGDTFWGVCNGKGHNHLGKILMKIREELRN